MEEPHEWITSLIANKDHSDIVLHVEAVQENHTFVVPGHSLLLRHASKVFDVMLEPGKFKEGTTGVAEIKVYGKKTDALNFIRYLYTKKLQILDTNGYVALMQTADSYDMTTLHQVCEKRIQSSLTPFSVCGIYSALSNISSETFRDLCKAMMLKFAFFIFGEKLHTSLSEEAMIFLLDSDRLNVLDEEQILRATWDWGHSQCILENEVGNKEPKDVVGKLLPLIKWSDISDVESRFPWFALQAHYKDISKSSCIIIKRNVENTISLSRFANALNIYENMNLATSSLNYERFYKKQILITFTSTHTVLLTGIEVNVCFDLQNSTSQAVAIEHELDFYVNTSHIQNISYKTTVTTRPSTSDKTFYFCNSTLDFCKPVVLRTNNIHCFYFQPKLYSFEAQKLNLHSDALMPGILGSDELVSFRITDKVVAIRKLFYYLGD